MEYQPAGVTHQLADYITKNLKKGYNLDALRFSLQNQGYSKISVEKAIEIANKQIAGQIPPLKEKPEITYKIIRDDNSQKEVIEFYPRKQSFFRRLLNIFFD